MTTFKNINSVELENEFLKLIFLPSYGFKLASMFDKKTNTEILFQSSSSKLEIPTYASPFNKYDSSGYDEVFPSIDRCPYPSGKYEGVIIPDHGEIWAMAWDVKKESENRIIASVKSKTLPYIFNKEVILEGNSVKFNYAVTNTDKDESFKFIWALHALLACSPATKILTPANLNQIMTVEHSTENLGPWGTLHTYPQTKSVSGKEINMSATEPAAAKNCEKFYFTSKNTEGWCGVEHTDTGLQVIYNYDAGKVPYLGVWKTQGGYRGDYNIALEPCTGIYDDLYLGNKIKKITEVRPLASYDWSLSVTVGKKLK